MDVHADGRELRDESGRLIALFQDQADAEHIAAAVNDHGRYEPAVQELATAAGLDHVRGWHLVEAIGEVTRQIRMVRRTMATREFDHHPTR